ncbi:circadian clock KaiB family protein [Aerosakkonemataceae cyanobacterium BLCC-F154]|uniref:Circadian clock KaiB family protein n=1 Tax=Floridaenema fluviatile BLCC-F154 TaxID=3153640 RepID=A0ABV4YE22_9CYAN
MEREDVKNLAKIFNKPVVKQITDERYCFRLYVAGTTPNSARALRNLQRIAEKYFPDNYELEVIDVYEQPETLLSENIVAIPTLIKASPLPVKRLVGDLSNTKKVLASLGISLKNKEVHYKKLHKDW